MAFRDDRVLISNRFVTSTGNGTAPVPLRDPDSFTASAERCVVHDLSIPNQKYFSSVSQLFKLLRDLE